MTPTVASVIEDAVTEARSVANRTHGEYVWHVVRSACCTGGRLCRSGELLLIAADDAGKRLDLAVGRAATASRQNEARRRA